MTAQNLQGQAVSHPSVYSWHDIDMAGQIFPYDVTLRETAPSMAIDLKLPRCMALPPIIRAAQASPHDTRWQEAIRYYKTTPGPISC